MAQRRVQLLQQRPQVLPRGVPGHAGRAQRVVDADRVPRQRRRDGAGRAVGGGRRRRLRQLHPVRRLRAALPEHAVHGRLLPLPHPHGGPRQGGPRARRRAGDPPARLPALEPADRRAPARAGAGRGRRRRADRPGARRRLGGRPRSADGRGDDPLRRLRGGLLPHLGPARGRPDPAARRDRVRADARAVVLRRAGRRDGLRRAGAAVRAPQPRRLARLRRQARDRARPARLHHLHRGLPEVLRRGVRRHRDRPRRRAVRRADPRRHAHPGGARRAHDHLPRPVPAEQAQGDLEGAARDPARDPRAWTSATSTGSPSGRTAAAPARGSRSRSPS